MCFTVIVGRKASATGEILVGHNEDNGGRVIASQYWVPAADHAQGETCVWEAGCAALPVPSHTFGYWWSQTLTAAGSRFADNFINENGVVIVSNNCNFTAEAGEPATGGGIGYGVRRIVAGQATSARHAVSLIAGLVETYGYTHQGRTYTVADRNEAWQVAVLQGRRWCARRVRDDEVAFMSNAFSIDGLTELDLMSPDLIEHARALGTYDPKDGPFSFRRAYQDAERRSAPKNRERVRTALRILTGRDWDDPEQYPPAIEPARPLGVADVQALLNGHNPAQPRTNGFYHQNLTDNCNPGTQDSHVTVLAAEPLLTCVWRTQGRPVEQFAFPQFPLAGPAPAQSFLAVEQACRAQFHATPGDLSYCEGRAIFTTLALQNFLEWLPEERLAMADRKKAFEGWAAQVARQAASRARALIGQNRDGARALLKRFNVLSHTAMLGRTAELVARLGQHTLVLPDSPISLSAPGTIKAALLSTPDFDATQADPKATLFGSPFVTSYNADLLRARPVSVEFRDVNGDGLPDAVFTFEKPDAIGGCLAGAREELFLWTRVAGKPACAFAIASIAA